MHPLFVGFSSLDIHRRPVFPQPFLPCWVVGQDLVHLIPKGLGMVEVVPMAEFVDDDVVDQMSRRFV